MAVLNFFATAMNQPSGFWQKILLNIFNFVGNYGWRVVVFTIILKLILSPLDIFQRVSMRKNQKITERIAPEMEKLKQQYGNDKAMLSQKQMQLNKREGFSYFSSCLPLIVTLVIFFWLLSGLNSISQYMSMKQYVAMYDVYVETQQTYWYDNGLTKEGGVVDFDRDEDVRIELDGFSVTFVKDLTGNEKERYETTINELSVEKGQTAVYESYNKELKVSWFWIDNIWSPDVPWKKPIPDKKQFNTNIGKFGSSSGRTGIDAPTLSHMTNMYNTVTLKLRVDPANKANGYLILPILSVALSFLSQFISSRQQKKSGQQLEGTSKSTMKVMMFMMPIMMGFFALSYTSVFTLYIITNSLMTLLINLGTTSILGLLDKKDGKSIVVKQKSGETEVLRYGRPDPNALKQNNTDDSKSVKKKTAKEILSNKGKNETGKKK